MSRWIVGSLVSVIALSACDVKKRADHLRDSTDQMKEKTNQIADVSDGMKNRMDQMKTQVAHTTFEEYINLVFGENSKPGSLTDNNEPRMIMYATGAVHSMEFQVWEGLPRQTVSELDEEFARSVRGFFVRITDYMPRDYQVNVWNPDRYYKGIGALGTALSDVNSHFKEHALAAGLGDLNFYSVIVRALKSRNGAGGDQQLPQTMKAVLEWKQEAIHLLQMRHIYIPMKVVTRMTDMQDRGSLGRIAVMTGGSEVDLAQFDDEQFRIWIGWLDEAQETRLTLRQLGYEPKYNQMILNLQKSITLKKGNPTGLSELQAATRESLMNNFIEKFQKIYQVTEPGYFSNQYSQTETGLPTN